MGIFSGVVAYLLQEGDARGSLLRCRRGRAWWLHTRQSRRHARDLNHQLRIIASVRLAMPTCTHYNTGQSPP